MSSTEDGPTEEDDQWMEKRERISYCLDQPVIDLWELRELALTRGGLVNAEMRRRAWHKLVGLELPLQQNENDDKENYGIVATRTDSRQNKKKKDAISKPKRPALLPKFRQPNNNDNSNTKANSTLKEKPASQQLIKQDSVASKEIDLIRREAGRSVLFRYLREKREESSQENISLPQQEKDLVDVLIQAVGRPLSKRQDKIHYYQGLHDVAGVLFHNLQQVDVTCAVLRRICGSHLRDALCADFSRLQWLLQTVLLPLLQAVDEELHEWIVDSDETEQVAMEFCNAVLPWLISWFQHDLSSEPIASRLMDAFLASHPLFPLYFAVAVIVHSNNRLEIFDSVASEDPCMVHIAMRGMLSKITVDHDNDTTDLIPSQELIDDALTILRRHPPRSLLNLAKTYKTQNGTQQVHCDLKKAEFVSVFKAPPSWALASRIGGDSPNDKEKDVLSFPSRPTSVLFLPEGNHGKLYVRHGRAKVASGVDCIMSPIDANVVFTQRRAEVPKSIEDKSSIWYILKRLFFSKSTAAEDVHSSPLLTYH